MEHETTVTVDCTPTWRGILPGLVYCAVNGETAEAREGAMKELMRLADMADAVIEQQRNS